MKHKKDLGSLVNIRRAELAQEGGRGAAHLLALEEMMEEVCVGVGAGVVGAGV